MMESAGKHILIIVENLPVPFDRRVWQEATTLQQAGYEVSVLSPKTRDYSQSVEVIDGISIYRYPLPTEGNGLGGYLLEYSAAVFWWCWLSWKIFLTKRFHAIHACNPPDLIFLAALPFKLFFRTKFLFDHHDLNPELYIAKYGKKDLFYSFLRFCERLTFRVADVVIATNESYKNIAITRGAIPSENIFVVRSGPDTTRIQLLPPEEPLKLGRRYLIGYVGVIGKQEGLDLLVQAVEHILYCRGRTDVQFVVIGDGPEGLAIRRYAAEKKVTAYMEFTGRIPDSTLFRYLNTCDVCVNPDVVNEMNDKSTMNKIMEYMALGKPIVQFEMTEGRFSAQEASLYARPNDPVDFADKILQLLADPDRRRQMGAYGRNRVLHHLQWTHEQPKVLQAYHCLFAS